MTAARARTAGAGEGWRVLLPPGWITLPTDPEAAPKAIGAFVDGVLEGKPRDEMITVRIELDQGLRKQAREAAKAGARYMHALARPIRGLPVSASLLTVPVRVGGDPDDLAATLAHVLGSAVGVVEHGFVQLGELSALRRLRREPTRFGDSPQAPDLMGTYVDYVVPVSDESVLVMAFTTTTEPVHRELVALFDAIANTLHQEPDA